MARSAFKPPGVAPSVRPRQAYAEEFPGRVFLHGIADAFATRAALSEPTEGIVVEAEPACLVDPDRTCPHFAHDSKRRLQIAREAGPLQAELPVLGHHDGLLERIALDENHHRANHTTLNNQRHATNAPNHPRLKQDNP